MRYWILSAPLGCLSACLVILLLFERTINCNMWMCHVDVFTLKHLRILLQTLKMKHFLLVAVVFKDNLINSLNGCV
jgi:hypothetical protein